MEKVSALVYLIYKVNDNMIFQNLCRSLPLLCRIDVEAFGIFACICASGIFESASCECTPCACSSTASRTFCPSVWRDPLGAVPRRPWRMLCAPVDATGLCCSCALSKGGQTSRISNGLWIRDRVALLLSVSCANDRLNDSLLSSRQADRRMLLCSSRMELCSPQHAGPEYDSSPLDARDWFRDEWSSNAVSACHRFTT